MKQRLLEPVLITAASLAITAVAVAAVVPGHARSAAEPAATSSQVWPAVLVSGSQAADTPAACPYLESKTKATACPFTANTPKAAGCPYAGQGNGDSRCPYLSARAAERDRTSCPYLNGTEGRSSCPYASPQTREHGATGPNPPGPHT